jgi:PAS domain S-box-containing protein
MGGVVLLNVFVCSLVGLSIHQGHHQYRERAEITTQNLTQVMENEIAGTIGTADLALLAVMDEYRKQRAGGAVDGKELNAYIERLRSRLPGVDALRIADAQGLLIYGSDVVPSAKISLADRPYFIRLRNDPNAGLVIPKPHISRANQKWVIVHARRIDQPDGSFGGVVFVAITLEQLSKTFSAINVGPRGVVTLRDGELAIIVRHPELQEAGGTTGNKSVAPELREMVAAGNTAGTFTGLSGNDTTTRTYSYRKIGAHPLYISVGLSPEDYLAEWRYVVAQQAALAVFFALITFLAAWLIYRIWKRQANAVEALARHEAKFRTVADFTFDWEYWKGPQEEILYMTPSCERVTGYSREEFVADPGLLLRIVHAEDRQLMERHLRDIAKPIADPDGAAMDFRIVRRDGEIRWITHHCRAISGRIGESMGRRVSNRDITERKRAEEALLAVQHNLTEAQAMSHLGNWELDLVHNRLTWSAEMYRIFGMPPEEFGASYETFLATLHPDDREMVNQAYLSSLDAGGRYDIEYRIIHKSDGQRRWGHARCEHERDASGKALRSFGTVLDITERKEAQARLAESESRLRTIIENEPECIKIIDAQGRLIHMNPAGLAMIEADSLEQVAGGQVIDLIAPEYRAAYSELMDRVLAGETMEMQYEVLGLKGGRRWLETHAVPMQDKGETVHLAVTRDISKRKQAEVELLRSNAELEQFSYSISHDMRQPLRMIASYLQLLEMGLKDQLDDEKREYFNFAVDGAKRLDTMLLGLLEYSRVGRKGEPPTWIESRVVLDEALLFLRPAIAEAQAVVHIEGDWPRIYVSPDEMLRLMQNLIGNALKFRVAGRTSEVIVTSEVVDKTWQMCVADNGVGIVPDQIGRLFQVFQRLQGRTAYEGTGIGLALCRKIAEHHGGRIWAESAGEDQGSRFCVDLPIKS